MNNFISLDVAARILAGKDADKESTGLWMALLEARADELLAVKTWASGGVSFMRRPEEWRIPRATFNAWRKTNGLLDETAQPGRRESQINAIKAEIVRCGFNPLAIPDGGKAKIKSACLNNPGLFTLSGFEHAWRSGLKDSVFKMENHSKFTPR